MRFRRDSEIIWAIVLSPILAIAWLWHWWREIVALFERKSIDAKKTPRDH